MTPVAEQLQRKLADRVIVVHTQRGTCFEWTGGRSRNGYGNVTYIDPDTGERRYIGAHRAAWLVERGPIPDGMIVMHTCDNRACCNPEHLRLGWQRQNIRDMHARRRPAVTHNGHRTGTGKPMVTMFTEAELRRIAELRKAA